MTAPVPCTRAAAVRSLLVCAALLVSAACAAQDLGRIEREITAVLGVHNVPGASVAVVVGDKVAWEQGIGIADRTTGRRVDASTLFQAASISKPVAAFGALRLVDQGRLALDLPARDLLPGRPTHPRYAATLRQLLSHTAGLSVSGFPGYPRGAALPSVQQVLDGERPANTDAVTAIAAPGARFEYSGGGYEVVQQLVESATGAAFDAALRGLVLVPAGMADSTYLQPLPEGVAPTAASGHGRTMRPVPGGWHVYPEQAAAGLWTTAGDLARFIIALQLAAAGRDGALLQPQTARDMLRPQATLQGSGVQYGLGLFVAGDAGRFAHQGINRGFRGTIRGTSRPGYALVVLTNSDNGDRAYRGIEEILRAAWSLPPLPR